MNQPRKLIVILALASLLGSGAAQAHKFEKIVVFGESSSDTGNVFEKQCPPDPAWGPWAPCSTAYSDGNLTNGPQWTEFLARRLRVPRPEPSELGGTNYAHAGAKTGEDNNLRVSLVGFGPSSGTPGTEVPGVLAQVNMYLGERGGFNKKDLVVIWGGTNDLRDIRNPEELAVVIQNLATAIATTACAGAKHIVVPNQLNASLAPIVRLGGTDPALAEATVRAFNDALRTTVSTLDNNPMLTCGFEPKLYYVDMFSAGEGVVAVSKLFGIPYSNIEDPAVDLSTFEIPDNIDPNEFLFLDTIHLTTPAQRVLAATAYRAIKFNRRRD